MIVSKATRIGGDYLSLPSVTVSSPGTIARRISVKNMDGLIAHLQHESREGHYRQYQNEDHPFLRGHPSLVVEGHPGHQNNVSGEAGPTKARLNKLLRH